MPRLITQTVVADFRSRLCDVAAELFTEMGRDGFNMRELAKRLRVSPMTAYRYFRDKDEILAALRARAFARFADRLEAANAAPGPRGAALEQAYAGFVRQDEPSYRLMFDLFQPAVHAVPEQALEERRARAALDQHARLMIQEGQWSGDPQAMGAVLWSALHGVMALGLTGKLADCERVLGETLNALGQAWRVGGEDCESWSVLPAHELPGHEKGAMPVYTGMAALPAE